MFLGEFQHTVDDKGRLAVPAKFRPPFADGLVVTRGLDKCLLVWTLDQWHEFADKLAELSLMQSDARRVVRHFFSGAVDTKLDKLGRVVLPQFLRDYAGLGDEVVVVGGPTRLEIWSRAGWDAELSESDENGAVFAEHLAGAGI